MCNILHWLFVHIHTSLRITSYFLCAASHLYPYVTFVADNIQSLLVALSSINPDSTIRVKAAYQSSSKKQGTNLKQIIPNHVVYYHGYPDIKNCLYYFAAGASEINSGQSLGSYDDIDMMCFMLGFKTEFPPTAISVLSDSRLASLLSLYKSSNILIIFMTLK